MSLSRPRNKVSRVLGAPSRSAGAGWCAQKGATRLRLFCTAHGWCSAAGPPPSSTRRCESMTTVVGGQFGSKQAKLHIGNFCIVHN